jgi:hypothetical protein
MEGNAEWGVVEWDFCGGVVGEDLWQNNPSPMRGGIEAGMG